MIDNFDMCLPYLREISFEVCQEMIDCVSLCTYLFSHSFNLHMKATNMKNIFHTKTKTIIFAVQKWLQTNLHLWINLHSGTPKFVNVCQQIQI